MRRYDMPDGNELYVGTHPTHAVVKGLFACRKVIVSETETDYFIEQWLDGFFQPSECLEWLGEAIP